MQSMSPEATTSSTGLCMYGVLHSVLYCGEHCYGVLSGESETSSPVSLPLVGEPHKNPSFSIPCTSLDG